MFTSLKIGWYSRRLKSGKSETRSGAIADVNALGRLGDVRAVAPLIEALGNPEWEVREIAARALGQLGDNRAVEPLIEALENFETTVRIATAEALGQLGDARAVEPLIRTLRANQGVYKQYVCIAAAKALGKLDDARAVEPLIKVLRDSLPNICQAAAEALGQLGDARAVEPLIKELGTHWDDARKAAVEALGQLGEPQWRQWVKGDSRKDLFAREDFARLGTSGEPRAVEPLLKALGDSQASICIAAAEALGQLGDARAVEPLIQVIDKGPLFIDWVNREKAATALVTLLSCHPSLTIPDASRVFQSLREPHGDQHEDRSLGTYSPSDCHGDRADEHTDHGIGVEISAGLHETYF